jgi:predicted dehydrogenase
MNRRHFMARSAAAAGYGLAARGSVNDRVRVACVGIRGQGAVHIQEYLKLPNVEIAALCDVDESVLAQRLRDIAAAGARRPATFTDVRRLIEDRSIDAISIATPNHWHALLGIWACQSGKDAYVEKPCSHNIFEARQLLAAARKYDRIVQHGSNNRSRISVQQAVREIRDGTIGDVYMARGLCYKLRDTIGHTPDVPVPPGVHYDLWLGPARQRPFSRNRFHYNWHWNWEYGNGDIGNQGIHQLDLARWGLGVKYPKRVSCIGGHFMFDDDQETPNTLVASFEFQENGRKRMLNFEVRHWYTNHEARVGEKNPSPSTIGNIFYGSKGYLAIDGGQVTGYRTFMGRQQQEIQGSSEGGNHWANFIQAVRSRKRAELNADIEEGYYSVILLHLANISYRLGRTLEFDEATFTCNSDPEATAMFTQQYRHPFVVSQNV